MASRGASFLAFSVALFCVVSSVSATLQDGRPRPKNFPDLPTETYDNTPALVDSTGFPVACTWYGFANVLFDAATGTACLTVMRKARTNATVNPPSRMTPYVYYTLKRLIDTATNESYCYQGCFNLASASLAAAPGVSAPTPLDAFAPPPVVATAPAPVVATVPPPVTFGVPPSSSFSPAPSLFPGAPPPVTFGVPPSSSFSPAPSLFPGAPPPLDASTPSLGAAVPPASIFAPPTSAPAPAVIVATVASPPSPPAGTGPVLLPNTGAFLQPTFLFSVLVTAVALFVNFAALRG